VAGDGVDKVLRGHAEGIDALLTMVAAATDGSNLTLDPDLDTFCLMDGALAAGLQLLEATAQLQTLAVAAALGKPASAQLLKAMHAAEVTSDLGGERFGAALAKVGSLHAGFINAGGFEASRAALQKFHDTVAAGGEPAALAASGQQVLDGMKTAQAGMVDKLDTLLAERVQRLELARYLTAAALLLGMATALYLFISFRKVLDGGLKEVAFHIDAMRDGDLTTMPRAWGADEAANLMHTLVEMQESLRGIVREVRSASDGVVIAAGETSA